MTADRCTSQQRRAVIIWRDTPLDLETDLYNQFAGCWSGGVEVVAWHSPAADRAALNWGDVRVTTHTLSELSEPERLLSELLDSTVSRIHLFYGLRTRVASQIMRALANPNNIVGIVAERPNDHGRSAVGMLLNTASALRYRILCRQVGRHISFFFAMGEVGIRQYENLGIPRAKLVVFRYPSPFARERIEPPVVVRDPDAASLKVLYVGRIGSKHKGVDVLLEVFRNQMVPKGVTLDLVGGYGDMLNLAVEAGQTDSSIRVLGAWRPEEVVGRMAEYDVCVVPSRYDGWNVVIGQAIQGGLAVVTTDQTTSDELVRFGECGIIVPAGDVGSLSDALSMLASDRELLDSYKRAAKSYAGRLSTQSLVEYMCEVLSIVTRGGELKDAPVPAWRQVAR